RSAIIAGVLKGDIFVSEHLTILQGAKVIGNIFTPILETDGEISIHGDITITCNPETALKEMQQFIEKHPNKMYFSNSLPQFPGL
ncbi:MAG TPA: polymer-forming cytoskeletal protein, partial [Spirochaetales bacterium]|nr:polymer-forming cytoskeletal protein [Spirochaetales bacterium]